MKSVTVRELINLAYEDLAIAGYEFDLSPEEIESARRRLELIAGELALDGSGVRLSASVLDDASGVPVGLARGLGAVLAMDLAASKGKTVGPEIKQRAASFSNRMAFAAAMPGTTRQNGYMPAGAGNAPWAGGYLQNSTQQSAIDQLFGHEDGN